MSAAVTGHDRLPILAATLLGGLATVVTWSIYGPVVGLPALVTSLALSAWAWRTGFTLDEAGLTVRSFFRARSEVIPWSNLVSVDVDEVVTGTNDGRATRLRIRFMVEGDSSPRQLIGCRAGTANQVLAAFRAREVAATDSRPQS